MLGFERKQVVVQEPISTAAAARLVCWSRSSWQLGAGVDDPHHERNISRRPFSTCRSSRSIPEAEHATSTGAGSSRAGCASRPQSTRR
eukprot:scaffold62669_cov40-Phaeocystis_antarctica.AAC.2